MKQELIDLAFKHKFSSKFLYQVAYKYSTKEDLRYLFWMTELQQWLREVHKIYVHIDHANIIMTQYEYEVYTTWEEKVKNISNKISLGDNRITFDTYTQALESGLLEALKLIK